MGSNEDADSPEPMDEAAAAVETPMIQDEGAAAAYRHQKTNPLTPKVKD